MPRTIIFSLLCAVSMCFSNCGGGGGGGSSDFAYDACSEIGAKIINGDSCSSSSSAVVEIQFLNFLGFQVGLCTGTAISSTAVLTAGHCQPDAFSAAQILVGDRVIAVGRTVRHPKYRETGAAVFNDVAIMFATEPLETRTAAILTSRSARLGEEGIIAGFGSDENENSGELLAGNMFVTDVSENHIFAAFNGIGSNACFGDSGGPLFLREGEEFAIAGVVSAGRADVENCGEGDITQYAALENSSLTSFIRNQVPTVSER